MLSNDRIRHVTLTHTRHTCPYHPVRAGCGGVRARQLHHQWRLLPACPCRAGGGVRAWACDTAGGRSALNVGTAVSEPWHWQLHWQVCCQIQTYTLAAAPAAEVQLLPVLTVLSESLLLPGPVLLHHRCCVSPDPTPDHQLHPQADIRPGRQPGAGGRSGGGLPPAAPRAL